MVVLIVNPLELTRRSRDSARLTDLANIQQAINISLQEGSAAGQLSPACNDNTATDVTCTDNSVAGSRAVNGTGWVKINFAGQSNVTVPVLSVDPTNNTTTGYYYRYCGNGTNWRILTNLESEKEKARESVDGGLDAAHYEVGSDLTSTWAFCTW